jgi:hypothetical protein
MTAVREARSVCETDEEACEAAWRRVELVLMEVKASCDEP